MDSHLLSFVPQTIGACLIGVYLSSVFYGLTILQTYQYFRRYWGRDKYYIRSLVAVLTWIVLSAAWLDFSLIFMGSALDTFCTVMNMYSMWHYLIDNYGNPVSIISAHWTIGAWIISALVVELLVKMFYAYRLWILSGKTLGRLATVIILLAIGTLVMMLIYDTLMVMCLRWGDRANKE